MSLIHPPKLLNSTIGLGLPTLINKSEYIGSKTIITTLIWPKLETSWKQGETTIAQENYTWITRWELEKPYLLTKIFDNENQFIGTYCDICSPVQRDGISFVCHDWYIDVWQTKDTSPIILDEDEIALALESNYLHPNEAQRAKATAYFLIETLSTTQNKDQSTA